MAESRSASSSAKGSRGFGSLQSGTASSLFDAAFSKPVARQSSRAELNRTEVPDANTLPSVGDGLVAKPPSPNQVFSPQISLPESTSSMGDNADDVIDECDDEGVSLSQPSVDSTATTTSSLIRNLDGTRLAGNETVKKRGSSEYDFDIEEDVEDSPPQPKKNRTDGSSKAMLPKRKPVYKHNWAAEDDEEEGEEQPKTKDADAAPARAAVSVTQQPAAPEISRRGEPIWKRKPSDSRVRNIKEPHQILQIGEHEDVKDDLRYLLTSLKGSDSLNVKTLSCTSLARKCISRQFRHFIRSTNGFSPLCSALVDSPTDEKFALSASAVVYLMCRDAGLVLMDTSSIRLLSQLLKMDRVSSGDPDLTKHYDTVWEVLTQWHKGGHESTGKNISFDLQREELSPSSLIIEALVYVLVQTKDVDVKAELLNLGILQWTVSKAEKAVGELERIGEGEEEEKKALRLLVPLERCFRILEISMAYHKKNQAFLISHRGSILVTTCYKLLCLSVTRLPQFSTPLRLALFRSLSNMAKVLTNLSHDNDLCSSKLGQLPSFFSHCLSTFTYLFPKYAGDVEGGAFDLLLIMSSLLVNLVEKNNSNRRKVIDCKAKFFINNVEEEDAALVALTKLFMHYEQTARETDEKIDQELFIEEPDQEESADSDDEGGDGRLDRAKMGELNEAEMLEALKGAMNKASCHMEDSVMASHIALLIGCVLQQNEDHAKSVKALLPDGDLSSMTEQLERYFEFLKYAGAAQNPLRSMEIIIRFLERIK